MVDRSAPSEGDAGIAAAHPVSRDPTRSLRPQDGVRAASNPDATPGGGFEPPTCGPKPHVFASYTTPDRDRTLARSVRDLCEHTFVPGPRFTEQTLRSAIAESESWAQVVRALGYRSAGGNWKTVRKYAEAWGIETDHFRSEEIATEGLKNRGVRPLSEVMVRNSSYSRTALKRRLFEESLLGRECSQCGQDEDWRGAKMALILDHINGVADDHRLENLRILCPNCAATLSTHCGRNRKRTLEERECAGCGESFMPAKRSQRYCSRRCGRRASSKASRRVERPPAGELAVEISLHGYLAAGRRYGVSDNAIRKWERFYREEGEWPDRSDAA